MTSFLSPNVVNSYHAGLVAADGSISTMTNTLRISLKDTDDGILKQFSRDIGWTGELKYFMDLPGANSVVKNKNAETPTVLLCLSGTRQITQDLESNYYIIPNKTLVLRPPTNLDYFNALSFLVGLTDGDGSVVLYNHQPKKWGTKYSLCIEIAGTFELLSWVKSIFDRIASNENRPNTEIIKQKHSNIWVYKVGGKRAYHIIKELQKIPTPTRLARKWDKIAEYEKMIGIST